MTNRLMYLAAALAIASGVEWPAAMAVQAAPPQSFATLQPGGFLTLTQQLPVTVVFVGYEPGSGVRDINPQGFIGPLGRTSCARKRSEIFYGFDRPIGLCFNFDYNLVFADAAFEDAFFGHLATLAEPRTQTVLQRAYNSQPIRSLNIGQNHRIHAPAVESWLGAHGGDIGVDTSRHTVFFINWYGRPDFRFHVYDYRVEPDVDTGFVFGATDFGLLSAWGGSDPAYRLWFYDLSAGPEHWTNNWNLTRADVDFDGSLDYRMPPVWEYGNLSGYRPFDDLTGDLAKVMRYVAVNLLFAPSPLYDPALSPPALPTTLEVDINVFRSGGPDVSAYLKPDIIVQRLQELQPLHQFSAEMTTFDIGGRIEQVFDCFVGYFEGGSSCYGNRLLNIAFADLFFYFYADHLQQYLEGSADYEIPAFAFHAPETDSLPFVGFADDNWVDGTQTYVTSFSSDGLLEFGLGATLTIIHESGHHLGLSHPHDGVDYETGEDYGPSDNTYFAWSGDQVLSIMSYLLSSTRFGRFDHDSMDRYLTVTYLNYANHVLGQIVASPRAGIVASRLAAADSAAAAAVARYQLLDYAGAAARARHAYDTLMQAAAAIDVPIEPQAWTADLRSKGLSPRFADPLDGKYRPR